MYKLAPALMLLALAPLRPPASPRPREPVLEVDHLYITVADHRPPVAALAAAGLSLDTTLVNRHDGGGTASLVVFFENAYLELLWADSTVSVSDSAGSGLDRLRRSTAWSPSAPSPFGIGLRRTPDAPDSLPYEGETSWEEWMQPGTTMFAFDGGDDEPSIFVVPRYMALPSWIGQMRSQRPALLDHALGVRRLTGVRVGGTPVPAAASALGDVAGLQFAEEAGPTLTLEFDGGAGQEEIDLRPSLPLVLRY